MKDLTTLIAKCWHNLIIPHNLVDAKLVHGNSAEVLADVVVTSVEPRIIFCC